MLPDRSEKSAVSCTPCEIRAEEGSFRSPQEYLDLEAARQDRPMLRPRELLRMNGRPMDAWNFSMAVLNADRNGTTHKRISPSEGV